jgi:WD40 repeat protein
MNMVCRWVIRSVVGLSCLGMAACNTNSPGGTPDYGPPGEAVSVRDIGAPLYKAEPAETLPAVVGHESHIVIPNAVIRLDKKQTVPAQIDGYLEAIATPVPVGSIAETDRDFAGYMVDPTRNNEQIPLRRLRPGDHVKDGQIVAVFNDLDVLVQIESSQKMMAASDQAIQDAKKASDTIAKLLDQLRKVGSAVSPAEILSQEATLARYQQNVSDSIREKARAEGEEKRGWAIHVKHRAKSMVNGVITKVMRSPGEFLKAGEPILEILATDEQQVEGNLDAMNAWAVTPGMKVWVEPATPVGPNLQYGSLDHRLDVTGVAITAHPNRPLVVSASLDRTAGVWDPFAPAGQSWSQLRLQHPTGVRSIACTGPKAGTKHWIATGGDDGRVRLWDATNPDKIPTEKPTREFDEAHGSAVTAITFSPDGRYLATAAGRDVWVWSVADGKKLYALPSDHRDAVTTVRFTPQATLVTVARDRAVRVWKVGEQGAHLERTIDHRKGNVDTLGLSSGGGRILFDQDDGRIDVVNLADGRPVGSIQNAAASARFATLAIFSADDSLVLTAGAGGDALGELQLWRAPQPGGRGSEWRRLVTLGRAAPTCAAFSPDPERQFMAVGTQAGRVHIWVRGTEEEMNRAVRTGRVTSVLRIDPKTVKVRVEMDTRPGEVMDLLQDKGAATIIIRPHDPDAAPKAAAPQARPADGGVVQAGAIAPVGNAVVPAVGGVREPLIPNVTPPGSLTIPQVNPLTGVLPTGLTPSGSLTDVRPLEKK